MIEQFINPDFYNSTLPRKKCGGRPSKSSLNGRMGGTDRGSNLQVQPMFTEEKLAAIRDQWIKEKSVRVQRLAQLYGEEERLQSLMNSPRASEVLAEYDRILPVPFQGISLSSLSTADDVIVLLRHAIGNIITAPSNYKENPELATLREKVVKTERGDLVKAKLFTALQTYFPTYREALIASYPTFDIQIIEFSKVTPNYWVTGDRKGKFKAALRWFVEDKLSICKDDPVSFREQLLARISQPLFRQYGLSSAVMACEYRTIADAVIDTYPELDIQLWEFKTHSLWNGEGGRDLVRKAVKWLVEARFGLSPSDPKFREKVVQFKARHLIDNRLGGMLANCEFRSHYAALSFAYQELALREEEFLRFPTNFWTGDEGRKRGIESTKDLIENKLGIKPEDPDFRIKIRWVRSQDFENFGLGGMLSSLYNSVISRGIIDAYPELGFKEWELSSVPHGFWQQDNCVNVGVAVRWVVEKKLHLTKTENPIKAEVLQLTRKHLEDLRLEGMMGATKLSLLRMLQIAYPQLNITEEDYLSAKELHKTQQKTDVVSPKEAGEIDLYNASLLFLSLPQNQAWEVVDQYWEYVKANPESNMDIPEYYTKVFLQGVV